MDEAENGLEWGAVTERLKRLRIAYEGDKRGSQQKFADRLGIQPTRWNNIENGSPLHRDLAIQLVQQCPGLTLDWIYLGRLPGLTIEMAARLGLEIPSEQKTA